MAQPLPLTTRSPGDLDLLAAIESSQAVAEFALDGTILRANDNFLSVVGYGLDEVKGRHHGILCDAAYAKTEDYRAFWKRLASGSRECAEVHRRAKDGRDVWLKASYNRVVPETGSAPRIVKVASDISQDKERLADLSGKVAAIERSQAVVEFALDGTILRANDNFLRTMGYELGEVEGQHHRIACEPSYAATAEYDAFWERLRRGSFEQGEFVRKRKDGSDVWLQATYNPILDDLGRPLKIVKFATDVSDARQQADEVKARLDAVDRAQAVAEFDLEGNLLDANENFLRTMGYAKRDVVGKHHSTFCTPELLQSKDYRDFWLRLGKGEVLAGRFERVGNYGRQVHIQATYNPVLDRLGRVVKVVKYAYDVTEEVQREEAVAASTAGMTTAVRGLGDSIEQIALRSREATEQVTAAQADAEEGAAALTASLEAIALIERSSAAIGDIVRVMADIANQTNLLAFNASIEAARAGEHGVGFSIVAGEVRKLAERSAEAAQQVGALIEQSVERVQEGAAVSRRAEASFGKILAGVTETSRAVAAISSTTEDQQRASHEVHALIETLGRTTDLG